MQGLVGLPVWCNILSWFEALAAEHQSAKVSSGGDKLAPQDAMVGVFTCMVAMNWDLYSTCNILSWVMLLQLNINQQRSASERRSWHLRMQGLVGIKALICTAHASISVGFKILQLNISQQRWTVERRSWHLSMQGLVGLPVGL